MLVDAAIDRHNGTLLEMASLANMLSAFGHVKLHIPMGANPKGLSYSLSKKLVFSDLLSTFMSTLGSNLICSKALLLTSERFSFPEDPSTKSNTNFGKRFFAKIFAS